MSTLVPDPIGLKNTSAVGINPATEDGNLATLTAKDFATQTTLALIKAKTDNLNILLSALRDAITGSGVSAKTLADLLTQLNLLLTESNFSTRTGEVQASPTANTVLARLKDLLTGITLAAGTNNIGDVDILTVPQSDYFDPLLGKTGIVKGVDFAASQTAQALWTPASGKKFVITDLSINFSAAGTLTLYDGETNDAAHRVSKWAAVINGGAEHAYKMPRKSGTADNVLRYTTGTGAAGSLTVWGYEE